MALKKKSAPAAAEDHPSPWKRARNPEKEREIKREAVLRTAAQMFNEKGFHATSLDEVAERLQITKPTLYYYIKSKDDILFECVRKGLDMLQSAIKAVGQSGGTAEDKLVAAIRQYAEIVTMDFGMCVIRVGEDPLPLDSRKRLRHIKGAIDQEFRELIRQGIDEGSIAPCDPKMAAFTIAGAVSWIGRWYRPDGPQTPQDIATQFIELLMSGLRAPEKRGAKPAAAVEGAGVARTSTPRKPRSAKPAS